MHYTNKQSKFLKLKICAATVDFKPLRWILKRKLPLSTLYMINNGYDMKKLPISYIYSCLMTQRQKSNPMVKNIKPKLDMIQSDIKSRPWWLLKPHYWCFFSVRECRLQPVACSLLQHIGNVSSFRWQDYVWANVRLSMFWLRFLVEGRNPEG